MLAWANTALRKGGEGSCRRQILNPTTDVRDGEVLCRLVLTHRPNMAAVQAALAKEDPVQRLAIFFNTVRHQLCVPILLDSQERCSSGDWSIFFSQEVVGTGTGRYAYSYTPKTLEIELK